MKTAERLIDQRLRGLQEGAARNFDVVRNTYGLPKDLMRDYRSLIDDAISRGGGIMIYADQQDPANTVIPPTYYAIIGPPFPTGPHGDRVMPYRCEVQLIRIASQRMQVGSLAGQKQFNVGTFRSPDEAEIPPVAYREIKQWVIRLTGQYE